MHFADNASKGLQKGQSISKTIRRVDFDWAKCKLSFKKQAFAIKKSLKK